MSELGTIWVYLEQSPLWWLAATLAAYALGDMAFRAAGRRPYVNAVLLAILLLGALLLTTGTSYGTYFEGAQFVHFLLGPATVALALPLYDNRRAIARSALPMLAALAAGSLAAIGSGLAIGWALGLDLVALKAIAPKSATSPVAIGVAEAIGAIPALTAALVILTGIFGAAVVTPLFNALRLTDYRARGFAAGVAASGIGTARALQVGATPGAFASIGMALNGLFTALAVPLIARWLLP